MGRREAIHVLEEMKTGGGKIFLTAAGTTEVDYTDRTAFALTLGATVDGYSLQDKTVDYDWKTGDPQELTKREITEIGFTLKTKLAEILSNDQYMKALGHGTSSTRALNATEAISNHPFTLFGNNLQNVPYRNLTITAIRDISTATPTSYTGAAITTNFTVDSVNGTIMAKVGGTVTPDTFGQAFDFTGTWARPKQEVLSINVGDIGDEKAYHSLLFLLPKTASGREKAFFFPKVYPGPPGALDCKSGTPRAMEVTFESALHPGCEDHYYVIDDVL